MLRRRGGGRVRTGLFGAWLFATNLAVGAFAPAAWGDVTLDQILAAGPGERDRLISEVVAAGSAGLRELRAEAEGRQKGQRDSHQISDVLAEVRARLAGTSKLAIERLDRIGDYAGTPLWDENEYLCSLLEEVGGANDFLRAEALRAYFRRYVKLVELSYEERETRDSLTRPREVLRGLLRQPLGPEVIATLDAHLPILLYHSRFQSMLGMRKLTTEFISSPLLARETYELLVELLIDNIEGKRTCGERWIPQGKDILHTGGDGTLERDETQAWPALKVDYLGVLWEAPQARMEDRERLWKAGVEAMLNPTGSNWDLWSLVQRWHSVLPSHLVPEEWVRALLKRACDARDEWDSTRFKVVTYILADYLRQIPWQQKDGHPDKPTWAEVLAWWDSGGSTTSPVRPLDGPLKAIGCLASAPYGDAERLQMLWAETEVLPGRTARVEQETEFGLMVFEVSASRLSWDDEALMVKWSCCLWTPDYIDLELEELPTNQRLGTQLRNGLTFYLSSDTRGIEGAPRHVGAVIMLIDKPEGLSIPKKPDLDWFFGEFYKRCPPGERSCLMDSPRTWSGRVLSKKHQVMIVERYYDGLGPIDMRSYTGRLGRDRRMISFATRRGGEKGLVFLRDCVAQQWPGWENVEPLLQECEALARSSKAAAGDRPELIDALLDSAKRAAALSELAHPERLEQMSEAQRVQGARAIALRVLPTESDPAELARLIEAMRALSGENFGYNPFATPAERRAAVLAWMGWAE